MSKFKHIFAFLLFLIIVLPMIYIPSVYAIEEGSVTKKITVVKGKDINDIQYKGMNVLHSSAWWYDDNGKKHPAFCVDPNKAGPGEIPAGQYDVNVTGAETNEKIAAILNNSIPYKTYQELGVANEEEAYAATKAAIWCVIGVSSYTDKNLWQSPGNPNVKTLFDKLVNLALSNPDPVQQAVYGSAKVDEKPILDGDTYYQRFKVAETSNSGKYIDSYKVELTGDYPNGTKITDESGVEKTNFKGDENFVIRVPASEVPENDTVEANVQITATLFSNVILIGKPLDGLEGQVQDMEIAMPYQDVITSAKMSVPNKPDTPDTPNPPPGSGNLIVIKLDARDNATPLEGVTFDCYNSNGQLIDTGTTDASGKWTPQIPGAGTYTIIERDTNNKYQLTAPTSQVITVQNDKTATVTFRDYPSQTVIVEKEDSETGEPIPGVQYEIMQIDGKGAWRATGKTDAEGKITWEDVPDGTYLVREVSTVEGYILDQTPQYVTVRNGQAPSLKFLNSKFPGLTITKIDQQTGEVVTDPATFKVEQVDGDYTTTVTTENGVATLENIPVGTYKITEVTAPEGYTLGDCPQTVYLGKDKNIQVVMKNLKKPVLTIEKIDGQTGDPVPGTKFELKKADGTIIGTVTTGDDGKVTVGMEGGEMGYLDPDVYTVTEVFVPEPYVLTGEHQDIRLNAGDNKSLLFANLEMPSITVEKYDEETGEKLPGAQFAIYEQADTARPVVEGMTDEDGKFTSGYIKPGTYVVKELNPPPGYMFSNKTSPDRVIVAKPGDGEIIVKVDNIKLPELIIKKIDSVTKEPIPGVVYEVKEVDDTSVQPTTATTDENGTIVIPGLKAGTYEITEISTPKPYILNDTPQRVKLEAGDQKTLMFENIKYPTLIIEKTDYTTNKGIPNTTFKIEHEEENGSIKMIGTFKTDADGRIKLPYVEPGWYIVTETIPAQGYQKPTNPVTRIYLNPGDNSYLNNDNVADGDTATNGIEITSGNGYEVVDGIVNYPLNSLVIKKADANTGEMLDGATFEVLRITGETSGQNGKLICTATTDHSGVIVITGLEAGAYAVREAKAPNNYIIAETDMQTVNMKADGTSIVEVVFRNYPYGAISINKVDGNTKKPLEGAEFTITTSSGAAVGDGKYTTDSDGNILIPNLKPGSYVITEVKAPDGYMLSTTPKTVQIGTTGETLTVNFTNYKKGGILIRKFDADNKELLHGATFEVKHSDGTSVGTSNGLYTTDESGTILIPDLEKGTYVITETKAPEGYILSENSSQTIKIDADKTYTVDFYNQKKSSLLIRKFDADSKKLLAGATFKIERPDGTVVGTSNGLYTTDENGTISLPELSKGTYIITETKAPEGYALSENPSQTIKIDTDKTYTVDFYNQKKSSLLIRKFDADSKKLLAGATFKIERPDGTVVGTSNGLYTTDENGTISLPELSKGTYIITETKAPEGYALSENPSQTIKIDTDKTYTVDFYNQKKSSLLIRKFDADSKKLLAGATFKIERPDGTVVGTSNGLYTTDENGTISLPELSKGTYIITETKAPEGYALSENPSQTIQIDNQKTYTVDFYNKKQLGVQIIKIDSQTKQPLAGAEFEIWNTSASSSTSVSSGSPAGVLVGTYTTNNNGVINVVLEEGTYEIIETKAPEGYQIDSHKQDIVVKDGEQISVTFTNTKIIGLEILKIDAVSKKPLQGAIFDVSKPNGEHVGTYTTDSNGYIMVSNLASGTYVITEKEAPYGYALDSVPQTVEVKAGAATRVTFEDSKLGGIVIKKLDSATEKPIEGCEFLITTFDGTEIGTFTTDRSGLIHLPNLPEGTYIAKETKAPKGYNLAQPKTFSIKDQTNQYLAGSDNNKIITIYNDPLGVSQIIKTDAVTGEPVAGATYVIAALNSGAGAYEQTVIAAGANASNVMINGLHTVIGEYTTSENGIINISNLPEGWYTLQEKTAPEGYERDATIYNFQITGNGVPTIIRLTNKPIMGRIALTKLSQDYNNNTGWDSGTPLAGAVYNIVDKNGVVIDKLTTGSDGTAISGQIKVGTYTLQEVKAPDWYGINPTPLKVTIQKQGQIVSVVAKDPSVNLMVGIKKTSDTKTCSWGDTINYYITGVGNESNVSLDNFTVHDKLPDPKVAQIRYFDTGLWNIKYNFKVSYTTNLNTAYTYLPGTYSSDKHNHIDLYAANMGLRNGEYVTQIKMEFQGSVAPGFKLMEAMSMQMTAGTNFVNGYQFTNYADVSGRWNGQIVTANSHWTIKMYGNPGKLPKTGW